MNTFGITPTEARENGLKYQRKARTTSAVFWSITLLPLLIYGLYYFGILNSTKRGEFQDLEEVVAFVATNSGTGTAFLVSPTTMLTARHVVEDLNIGDEVLLRFERISPPIETTATLQWKDDTAYPEGDLDYFLTDAAVLTLTEPDLLADYAPLLIGDSDGIPNLTEVIAIGYPNGDYSITTGKINSDSFEGRDLFKLDAAVNPGNSGGPLLSYDTQEVIGLCVGKRRGIVQGENIAVKINDVVQLVERSGASIY